MHTVRKVTEDLLWVGVNDNRLEKFENLHPIPEGVSYNSYVLLDEQVVLFDTVDSKVSHQFFDNLDYALQGRKVDYIICHHMEPDHACCIRDVILRYPDVKLVGTDKGIMLARQFGVVIDSANVIEVTDGSTLNTGKHQFTFHTAPMVHWPEVVMTYDETNGVLFSADAFGTFGTMNGAIFNDELDFERQYLDSARRYYSNIVGKYGPHVQYILKKLQSLDIKMILPLHGPIWRNNFNYYIDKYDKWSSYTPEENGVLILYGTMYGGTEFAANVVATMLVERGITNIKVLDVAKVQTSYLVAETFKYSHIVLAAPTYNLEIFPPMEHYLLRLKHLQMKNRTFALLSNGSWAPKAGDLMFEYIDEEMSQMTVLDDQVGVVSLLNDNNKNEMESMVEALILDLQSK